MRKYINANGHKGIEKLSFVHFDSIECKNNAINQFFGEGKIISHVIGYITDEENYRIGYCEEHYIDSGSDNYFYTALIY